MNIFTGISFEFKFLLINVAIILIIIFIILLLREKPIDVVKSNDDQVLFQIFKNGIYGFKVKGFHGMPKVIYFTRYTDLSVYVDKKINGWINNRAC